MTEAQAELNAIAARVHRIEAAVDDKDSLSDLDENDFWKEVTAAFRGFVESHVAKLRAEIATLEAKTVQLEAEIVRVKAATPKYLGVFREGRIYDENAMVTHDGSVWHCNQKTSTPPGNGSAAWILAVKRGERGRDAKGAT
jgi:hypothetical protein